MPMQKRTRKEDISNQVKLSACEGFSADSRLRNSRKRRHPNRNQPYSSKARNYPGNPFERASIVRVHCGRPVFLTWLHLFRLHHPPQICCRVVLENSWEIFLWGQKENTVLTMLLLRICLGEWFCNDRSAAKRLLVSSQPSGGSSEGWVTEKGESQGNADAHQGSLYVSPGP